MPHKFSLNLVLNGSNFSSPYELQSETDMISKYLRDNNIAARVSPSFYSLFMVEQYEFSAFLFLSLALSLVTT